MRLFGGGERNGAVGAAGVLSAAQPNVADRSRIVEPRLCIAVVVAGIAAGIVAALLMLLLRLVQHSAWAYSSGPFVDAVTAAPPLRRVIVMTAAGAVTAGGLLLIRRLIRPGPGLCSAIWRHAGRLPFVRTVAGGILSIVIVGMGASLGREAAPKEIAAAVAAWIARRTALSRAQRRILVACGAGAGMAAVYDVPLGGALFALEVLLGSFAIGGAVPAFAMAAIATAVAAIVIPLQPAFAVPPLRADLATTGWAIAFGPLAGLLSVGLVRTVAWTSAHRPRGNAILAIPPLVFGALGILAIAFPQVLGNGKNIAQLALSDKLGMALLAALLVAKFIATVGCLATGAPGGLFMPTIAIGALAGGLTGQLWQQHWVLHDAGSCVLIGAGALLAASTQGPVSATVLILELSANANGLILPLVIAVVEAVAVANLFDTRSIYSARLPPANARTGGEFAADAGRPAYVGGHPVLSWRQEARRADYRDHR